MPLVCKTRLARLDSFRYSSERARRVSVLEMNPRNSVTASKVMTNMERYCFQFFLSSRSMSFNINAFTTLYHPPKEDFR